LHPILVFIKLTGERHY